MTTIRLYGIALIERRRDAHSGYVGTVPAREDRGTTLERPIIAESPATARKYLTYSEALMAAEELSLRGAYLAHRLEPVGLLGVEA